MTTHTHQSTSYTSIHTYINTLNCYSPVVSSITWVLDQLIHIFSPSFVIYITLPSLVYPHFAAISQFSKIIRVRKIASKLRKIPRQTNKTKIRLWRHMHYVRVYNKYTEMCKKIAKTHENAHFVWKMSNGLRYIQKYFRKK